MILTVGGEKGGPGKTTISTNLAAIANTNGGDVLLINTDPQDSAGFWASNRISLYPTKKQIPCISLRGEMIAKDIQDLSHRYKLVIIDAGGRDSVELRAALVVTELFLIPLRPSQFDVWTLPKLQELLGMVAPINPTLKALVVANQVHPTSFDRSRLELEKLLSDYPRIHLLKTMIGSRAAYQNAICEGLSVTEMLKKDPKANSEILGLYREVFNEV
jgi:chromosome partitioning protein